jgi:hypothetical protein
LTDELDAEDWALTLYDDVLGAELSSAQAALKDCGAQVSQIWDAVGSFARWLTGMLRDLNSRGVIEYDALGEAWRGPSLFNSEQDISRTFREPDWTDEVLVTGRPDLVLQTSETRRRVIELKLGSGHPEADAAQACLYHELLGAEGYVALVCFEGSALPRDVLLSSDGIVRARPALMTLIGALAGVLKGQPPPPQSGWPKPAGEAERAQGAQLLEALSNFNALASLEGEPLVGPTFVRYVLKPGKQTPVRRITSLGADLQVRLLLDAEPMIGVSGSGITVDVQRRKRDVVLFKDLRDRLQAKLGTPDSSRILAGVDLTGKIEFVDLARDVPHLLVAGVPGSGKSEWLRAAAASLIVANSPDTLRLVPVDPKRNAFGELKGSAYLWSSDIRIDKPEASVAQVLDALIDEMKRRNELFAKKSADNLAEFRLKTGSQLPRIVCLVDEYAELLMSKKKADREQVEDRFIRLAQMGRSAGIHLVLATQHPSAQIVTSLLKANIPGRVALQVSSKVQSMVIFDQTGAECLLGRGDLLLKATSHVPLRLQSAYLSDSDRREIFGGK